MNRIFVGLATIAVVASLFVAGPYATAMSVNGDPMSINGPPLSRNYYDARKFGVSPFSADNAGPLQAAINKAVTDGVALYIPSAGTGCYKYTAPLTISGNLQIVGDYVLSNSGGSLNVPSGSPALQGSVLCPTANGSDAIDISGTGLTVDISNIGILWQTLYGLSSTTTGDGIHYIPSSTNTGLQNSRWDKIIIMGHDGNHYAVNLQNPIYNLINQVVGFGGGLIKITTNAGNFGNTTFIQPYGIIAAGGTANGIDLSADTAQHLNMIDFIRPQVNVVNSGIVSGNPATSAQYIFHQDANTQNVRLVAPDFETNVSANSQYGGPNIGNEYDFGAMFTTAAANNMPAWTTAGAFTAQTARTFTDTTSSGTVAVGANYGLTTGTVKASNATTYTAYATLYLPTPVAGTGATFTTPYSLYATSNILTTGGIAAQSGVSNLAGTLQFNVNNSSNTTAIGTGTTSGAVNVGGGSNQINLTAKVGTGASASSLTLTQGALGFTKMTASGSAPGAVGGKIELVCGTNAGSAKLVAYAGTSGTAVTILDNIGSGVTGC